MRTNTISIRAAMSCVPLLLLPLLSACCAQSGVTVDKGVSPEPALHAAALPTTVDACAWRSPVLAKPVREFGDDFHGLEYSLPQGTVIRAAASGVVVYAGRGLGGFRHMVIVKSGDHHLVAYGVNVAPMLREGDDIEQGDTVARTTGDPTGTEFRLEVRDRGKPVDPRLLIREAT